MCANIEHFVQRQFAAHFVQVRLQGFTLDIIHDEIPATVFTELLVDSGQIGMGQAGEQMGLVFEGRGCLVKLLRVKVTLAHLLDGEWSIAKLCIGRFVDGPEASFANLTEDAIAPFEDVLLYEQACEGIADWAMGGIVQRAPTSGAEHRLCPVGRATSIAKDGRR